MRLRRGTPNVILAFQVRLGLYTAFNNKKKMVLVEKAQSWTHDFEANIERASSHLWPVFTLTQILHSHVYKYTHQFNFIPLFPSYQTVGCAHFRKDCM